ncbi:phospholipase D/nuclease [Laetiporus sulphureus 93-53]|uniref:Phospholipase n=1 Tax=Laetiporus sulphureus 93-53 TaxID=1314785 RepID=A0A165EYR1_9APHY|nr:phospholipase D/nuclease [Laetiporus sulphureus 93-53]KZT08000.1 phospholipase D/nuclease [Laetiporus sulphureus 93-53]
MSKYLKDIKHAVDQKFEQLDHQFDNIDKLTAKGLRHAQLTTMGLINPNRRHDSETEKEEDRIRAAINSSHRFESFAGLREQNFVKWHIDGHDYMYALSEMLDSAKEVIFILDWWLSPELYLRRPAAYHQQWRLDRLLKRKAEEGVRIYVIVYKEVTQTMSMSSSHTKHALEDLHPHIACMRHPDHIGSRDDVAFWSHHEKLVIVDNHRAAVGGLDLCYGRWDLPAHPLADVHPADPRNIVFPGQDYNNARILDFKDVKDYVNNGLSVLETARMPWHDVHTTLCGPAVLDLVQHFVERWNEVKLRKYEKEHRYDWLALPKEEEEEEEPPTPDEERRRHPHRDKWREIGRDFRQRFHGIHRHEVLDQLDDPKLYPRPPNGTCRVQAVRSVSDWSHGVLTEHSIQNAYCQLIMEASHYIYIENQFFISNTQKEGPIKNQIAAALVARILRAAREGVKFKVVILIPEVPGFAGPVKEETAIKTIMAAQYRTMNRGGHSIYEEIRRAGFEPENYIRFYHLRAYDRINAPYTSYLSQIEQISSVRFHQAMAAVARLWVGPGEEKDAPANLTVVLPTGTLSEETSAAGPPRPEMKTETYPLPKSYQEAHDILWRWKEAASKLRSDESVADNVVQHMLHDKTSLLEEKWLGTPEEEKAAYVSELLYIHSKLMIVDDRRVIIGSANINDRSQKGDGDSEIALVIEDEDMIPTTMDGKPYMASRFAASLRRKLYREHLGLIAPHFCDDIEEVTSFMRPAPHPNSDETFDKEDYMVADPLSEETERLWNETAKHNRDIFTEIFRPVPTNLTRDWNAYWRYIPKNMPGHVAPEIPIERVKDRLSKVRGSLVECPLDFLIDEKVFVQGVDWKGLNPTLPIYI